MGPVFGIKGGGNGGGYAQVVPMEDVQPALQRRLPRREAAHNLLPAALDASVYHGNELGIDPQTITWPRTLDVNDRELRYTVVGPRGRAHGYPRENGFVIAAASEIMAVFALASRPEGPAAPARQHRRRLDARGQARDRRRPQGRRGDDRDHEGRDQAEPGTDARRPARARARRSLREHRAREQLDHRGPRRAEARRLRRDRGRVRVGPGLPEVLRHRLPVRRVHTERRGAGHHRCGRPSRTGAWRSRI